MLSGALLRITAIFLVSSLGAIVHWLGPKVPLGEIIFWRSAVSLIPILIYMALRGQLRTLRTKHPRMHLIRGLLGGVTMAFSFLSLTLLPVANATAIGFLGPVLAMPLAAWMLKEQVATRYIVAVCVGFAGMLLMLAHAFTAPETGFVTGVLAALGFAVTMAISRVQVRAMTAHESTGAIAFSFALTATCIGLLLTPPWAWTVSDPNTVALLVLCGVLGGLGHIAGTEASARVTVSALAAFEFTGLIFAAGYDFILFDARLEPLQIAGMLTIVASALVILRPVKTKAAAPL